MGETREGPPGRCRALARGAKDVAFLALGAFPTPSQLITIGNDPAPPATLTPSPLRRENFTFLFFNIELLSRARRSLERHIPLSIRVGLSRNKGFLHDPSEAHQKHAFLAPREEAKSEEGHNWPGPGHRQNRPEGRHPRSAPEVGDPNREGARAPPERVLDSGRGGARALEEKTPQPPKAHR